MDEVMVTFQAADRTPVDLRVPAFVTARELLGMLAEAIGIAVTPDSRLQAEPLGRILDNGLTLQDEGVRHGALLTLL